MSDQISFQVGGYPPAKNEALSMLGAGHTHADRVLKLLEAARAEAAASGFDGFGSRPVGLDLIVRCRRDGSRSDATNYLGGVADVLEGKAHRGNLDHLGELGHVFLYENDRQIEEVRYRWEESAIASYQVRFWALDSVSPTTDPAAQPEDSARTTISERPQPADTPTNDCFTRARLEADGFKGWRTFAELREGALREVPTVGGLYVVWRDPTQGPSFLGASPAGWFKGEDPTVALRQLQANWVDRAEIVYIGQSKSLKRRLNEFERFGSGAPVGHKGGRLIWQLADAVDLRLAWKATPDADPKRLETELIAAFRDRYGKPPFANNPHLYGR